VEFEAVVAIRGALRTARPTCAPTVFDALEFSNAKVGRGPLTAPGLEREFSNSRKRSRIQSANSFREFSPRWKQKSAGANQRTGAFEFL